MEKKTNSRVLNEREFAQAVGLSYAKIKKMRQSGLFNGYCQVGRRILYRDPQHVEAFLSQFEKLA
jgi:predicted DNA-binding transcriptional regulator AlpA